MVYAYGGVGRLKLGRTSLVTDLTNSRRFSPLGRPFGRVPRGCVLNLATWLCPATQAVLPSAVGRPASPCSPSLPACPVSSCPAARSPCPGSTTRAALVPAPASAAQQQPRPSSPHLRWTCDRSVPRPRPVPARPKPTAPWLPTGTGLWIHEWPKTMHGSASAVVHRASAYHVTTLYVRTGTKKGGFVGGPILRRLLPATRGTSIRVVAWDFPTLDHPTWDARRLAAAARYRPPGRGTPRVAAVAPGHRDGVRRARGRHASGIELVSPDAATAPPSRTPILGTVPWPSELRRGRFPYATVAHYSNALLPMAYWYNRGPASVTSYSIRWLRRYHRPVLPVGQGFDSHVDAPLPAAQPPEPRSHSVLPGGTPGSCHGGQPLVLADRGPRAMARALETTATASSYILGTQPRRTRWRHPVRRHPAPRRPAVAPGRCESSSRRREVSEPRRTLL